MPLKIPAGAFDPFMPKPYQESTYKPTLEDLYLWAGFGIFAVVACCCYCTSPSEVCYNL